MTTLVNITHCINPLYPKQNCAAPKITFSIPHGLYTKRRRPLKIPPSIHRIVAAAVSPTTASFSAAAGRNVAITGASIPEREGEGGTKQAVCGGGRLPATNERNGACSTVSSSSSVRPYYRPPSSENPVLIASVAVCLRAAAVAPLSSSSRIVCLLQSPPPPSLPREPCTGCCVVIF